MAKSIHAMASIAAIGALPIANQTSALHEKAAIVSDEAQGTKLALSVIAEAKGQGNVWNIYVAKLSVLPVTARKAFLSVLSKHQSDIRAYVKNADDDEMMRKASASARVALSNLTTIARAMQAGFTVEMMHKNGELARNASGDCVCVNPFYTILASARMFLSSQGQGSTKGRKAKPFIDKLKAFLADNAKSVKDYRDAAEMTVALAAVAK